MLKNTPTIHKGDTDQEGLDRILARFFAASIVFFLKEEFLPVADAVCFSASESEAEQSTNQDQVAGEGGGAGSSTQVAGAQSQASGNGSSVSHVLQGATVTATKGSVINVSSEDASTAQDAIVGGYEDENAALNAGTQFAADAADVEDTALASNTAVLQGAEEDAQDSIAAGVTDTGINASFGEQAIQAAENAEATSTTALETNAAESISGASQDAANAQIGENDLLTNQQQPLGSGTVATVSQEQGGGILDNISTWVAIITGVIAIIYYFRKGKA